VYAFENEIKNIIINGESVPVGIIIQQIDELLKNNNDIKD